MKKRILACIFALCSLSAVLATACGSGEQPREIMEPNLLQLGSQSISYYESSGSGAPIMLVHGNSSSARAFRKQLEGDLGQNFHVIAIDLPGHGNSDPAAEIEDYNLRAYASIVAAAASALQMEDAVFAGWSLGGHILLQGHDLLPQASGFVIFGTPPLTMPPAMGEAFLPNPAMVVAFKPVITEEEALAFATAFFAPEAAIDVAPFVVEVLATDGNARAGLAASLAPDSPAAKNLQDEVAVAGHLNAPLAIFHGEGDQLVSEPYISGLNIPSLWRSQVQIIPSAGHTPQWEQPEAFDELLRAFVVEVNRNNHTENNKP